MANALDYLLWRGDLPLAVSPLNEVDNYILCKLGCPDFSGIVPADGTVPLALAAERYFALEKPRSMGVLASPGILAALRLASKTVRFGPVRVGDYVNRLDPQKEEQFSALTAWLPDGSRYVSFRGTDDTLLAWKEDFLLGVEDAIPAQRDAADYLLEQARKEPGPLIVGGHSKGGNLAVYAAMAAPPEVQERIVAVYNNDGPGFRTDISQEPAYLRIRDRVHTIVSQYTIVGMLLHNETNLTVVRSDRTGIAAHDGFRWQVVGTSFERCAGLSAATNAFENAITEIENRMDPPARRRFVDALFDMLCSTGARTISDLTAHKLRQAAAMAQKLRKTPEVSRFVLTLAELTAKEALSNVKPRLRRRADPQSEEEA